MRTKRDGSPPSISGQELATLSTLEDPDAKLGKELVNDECASKTGLPGSLSTADKSDGLRASAKHMFRRRRRRMRPSHRTWDESIMPYGQLGSIFESEEEDETPEHKSTTDESNENTSDEDTSDTSDDEDEEEDEEPWSELLLPLEEPESMDDDSPSRLEWLRQKRESNEKNKHLDRIMGMIGHEPIKAHFLWVKERVALAKQWDEDLKELNLDLVIYGSDGTGKRLMAKIYADFLYSIGAIPYKKFQISKGSKLMLREGNKPTVVFFVNADIITYQHEVEAIMNTVREAEDGMILIMSYRSDVNEYALKATKESRRRLSRPITLDNYNEAQTKLLITQLLREKLPNDAEERELMLKILTKNAVQKSASDGAKFTNMHFIYGMTQDVLERRQRRLDTEWVAWMKSHDPQDNQVTWDQRGSPCKLEDIQGSNPKDIKSTSDAWKEIQKMIGLDAVKSEIEQLFTLAELNHQRQSLGRKALPVTLNRCFLGAPGVGKTTVARLYGKILSELGLLSNSVITIKQASDLIGPVIGKSEELTTTALDQARGGILVIDDAQMLYQQNSQGSRESDIYRTAVIDTIVAKVSGAPGEDRCVILCGYENEMRDMFLNSNPGLQRRFPLENSLRFKSYDDDELVEILKQKMEDQDLAASKDGIKAAREVMSRMRSGPTFGNAGDVENLLSRAIMRRYDRLKCGGFGFLQMEEQTLEPIDFDPDYRRLSAADKRLDDLFSTFIGFEAIAKQFQGYQKMATGMRRHNIDPRPHIPWAFIFKGPPGSGKTTFARQVGHLFFDMGFMSSAEVVSCSAKDLTGEYLGQTSPKIIRQFERALGRVLFIDEAYRLGQGSQYGIEAAGEIVTAMTQPRYLGNMVVILAGYETEMAKFMRLNPGLRSRFPIEVDFPQMEPGNCFRLFQQILGKVSIEFSSSAEGEGDQLIVLGVEAFRQLTSVAGWANGRDVKSLAQKMMAQVFIRQVEAESEVVPEKLIVSYGELLDFLMEELKIRGCSAKRSNFSSDAFRERLRHVGFDADISDKVLQVGDSHRSEHPSVGRSDGVEETRHESKEAEGGIEITGEVNSESPGPNPSESHNQSVPLISSSSGADESVAGSHQPRLSQIQEHRIHDQLEAHQFRLLQLDPGSRGEPLRASLQPWPLSECPKYTALSYTWGSDQPPCWIEINGASVQITPSLHDALDQLRNTTDKLLVWADAICINQSDVAEKSAQVARMRKIYAGADKLHIWMGHPSNPGDDQVAFDLLKRLRKIFLAEGNFDELLMEVDQYHYSSQAPVWETNVWVELLSEPIKENDWKKLGQFFLQPWFTRVWVYQEVASFANWSAFNISVAYGESRIGWDDLMMAATGISANPDFLRMLFDEETTPRHKFPSTIMATIQRERNTHFSVVDIRRLGVVDDDFLGLFLEADKTNRPTIAVDALIDVSSYHNKVVSAFRGKSSQENAAASSTASPRKHESMLLRLELNQLERSVKEALGKKVGLERVAMRLVRNKPPGRWSGGQLGRLWHHLQLSQQLSSTDPRDKIFAFLGHLGEGLAEDPLLKPTYEKSVADVFVDVTLFFIQRDMCLSIFELIYHKTREGPKIPGLPSWANDWTQTGSLQPFDLSEFCTGTSDRSGYSKHALRVEVSPDRRRLRLPVYMVSRTSCLTKDSRMLHGWYMNILGHNESVCWDCVYADEHCDDPTKEVRRFGNSKSRIMQDLFVRDDGALLDMGAKYPTGGRTFDAFLRTFVMNQGYCDQNHQLHNDDDKREEGEQDENGHEEWNDHDSTEDNGSNEESDDKSRRQPNILLSTAGRYLLKELSRNGLHSENKGDLIKFFTKENESDKWYGLLPSRRMCFTDDGYIGWVPQRTEVSDMICVIPGARTPYVIREVADGWEMIGAAYVHGLMDQLVDDSELCLTKRGKEILSESLQPNYISLI